jgi:hypothetical protein
MLQNLWTCSVSKYLHGVLECRCRRNLLIWYVGYLGNEIKVYFYVQMKCSLLFRTMYWIKSCCIEVTLNDGTCQPNFTNIHRSVQKLLVGDTQTDRHTHTQTGW